MKELGNSYGKGSKLSERRFRVFIKFVAADLTATQTD